MRGATRVATVLLVVAAACSSDGDDGDGSPTTAVATTAPVETATPSEMPRSGCCDGVELSPGRYRLPSFWRTPLGVEVEAGWRAVYENAAVLFALVQGQNEALDPSCWLYLVRAPAGLDPETVIDDMAAMSVLTATSPPAPVTIAGFEGVTFDAVAAEDPSQPEVPANGIEAGAARLEALNETGYFTTGFFVTTATRGSTLRFIALDVGTDRTMLVLIDAPAGDFDAFAADADDVLATLAALPG